MSRESKKELLVAIDIGTTKVVAVVAEALDEPGKFDVIGTGQAPTGGGIRNGIVVNIDTTVKAIQKALEEAELMADCRIREAIVGISGAHIQSINSTGMVAIRDKEVSAYDVERVIDTARSIQYSNDLRILHVLRQQYIIDRQQGIEEPIGMSGVRLDVKVHIILSEETACQNILKCVRRCGLEPRDLTLNALAGSSICLTSDEKRQGVLYIDMGSGTTDIAFYKDGYIKYSKVYEEGGHRITNDLSQVLYIPVPEAEDLKIEKGIAKRDLVGPQDQVELSPFGEEDRQPRIIEHGIIGDIIYSRLEVIFVEILQDLEQDGLSPNSVVITGGSANLTGINLVAEDIFGKPVRTGRPLYHGSLSDIVCRPEYTTVMGLLLQSRNNRDVVNGSRGQNLLSKIRDFFWRTTP
ncbi:cell division protein FtsA [Taylorella asinigenitalis 14/45]|uniref:Cell division protein FtsA n=2 Tax=Taylorella asinigenitalis TaxID=84590 RepID=G4QC52_TAYAM|nr:cell division protein FtsA [Taylorella asinigenitalis]AEP37021.1 Cell division protein FtsA [Taylorella asinigenitalis MCE3]CCG19420.1 cell division protein FtsA [Taylorella asinigenitalis 14/45]